MDKKVVQKDESVRMEITFTKSQMETFNKVKGLMSHVNPSPTVAEVFEYMAKHYLKRKDLVGNSNAINSSGMRDTESVSDCEETKTDTSAYEAHCLGEGSRTMPAFKFKQP